MRFIVNLIKINMSDISFTYLKIAFKILFFRSFALNSMDKKILRELGTKGFYLEIGGNDGVTQSNTYRLYRNGWKGILIEPNYQSYKLCKHFRRRDAIVNSACVSLSHEEPFVYLSDKNLESSQFNIALNDEKYIAPAKPLNSILREQQAPKFIEFFSLDVEGAELEVLKGLNFDEYEFGVILVEIRMDVAVVVSYLHSYGYELVTKYSHHDFLFKRQ